MGVLWQANPWPSLLTVTHGHNNKCICIFNARCYTEEQLGKMSRIKLQVKRIPTLND